ncbi:MAG: type II secretion system protein, partial [Patescibacteria group bacterium]
MFIKLKKRRAFTMVEVIVTATIFVTVALISVMVLSNVLKSSKKIRSQIFLYTEAHALMDLVMRDIQRNAIDYEAYYAREVLGETGWATLDFGYYGQAFIHPGTLGGPSDAGPYQGITGYGTYCSDLVSAYPADCPDAIPVADSLDYETGAHPFTDIDDVNPSYSETQDTMNAFCEDDSTCDDLTHYAANELILINSTGDERIVITQESLNDDATDFYLSKVILSGLDTNNDGIDDF